MKTSRLCSALVASAAVTSLWAGAALPALAADTTVVMVPASIANDCSTNVTGPLATWLASVPNNSTAQFRAGDCFQVNFTINVVDRSNLIIDGDGARFEARVTFAEQPIISRPMWSFMGGNNIIIRDLSVKGTNPTPRFNRSRAFYPLIKFIGTQASTVTNVTGSNSWGDFVSITPDTRGLGPDVFPNGITVKDSSSTISGRYAVMCNGCENVMVRDNTFTDTGYQVFDIEVEHPDWHARDISYIDNIIGGRIGLSVLVNAGIGHDVTGIRFIGNEMVTDPLSCSSPVEVLDTAPIKSDWLIADNKLRTLGAATKLSGVTNARFENNVVQIVPGGGCEEKGTAVRATNAEVDVTRNDLPGYTNVLSAKGVVTGTVCGNRLTGTPYDDPIVCP